MNVRCTLVILSDHKARYHDDRAFGSGSEREADINDDRLALETVELLSDWVARYGEYCQRKVLSVLGRHLYDLAFGPSSGPLRSAFEATYGWFLEHPDRRPSDRLRLRLELHPGAQRLARLPWEFLAMPGEEDGSCCFLAGQRTDLILTRFVPSGKLQDPGKDSVDQLKVLVIRSEPPGLSSTRGKEEAETITRVLRSQRVDVRECEQPTIDEVRGLMDWGPHVVHFIGHGRDGGLYFLRDQREIEQNLAENALREADNWARKQRGQAPLELIPPEEVHGKYADGKTVQAVLNCSELRLVLLHACEGARPNAQAQSLASFGDAARDLAYDGQIPAVIAMQYVIENGDAQRFTSALYERIRAGDCIDEAVRAARREIAESGTGSRQAWDHRSFGAPVAYLRSDRRIVNPALWSDGEGEGARPQAPVVDKQLCPYPNECPGRVVPGAVVCGECRRPLMRCPAGHLMPAERDESGRNPICTLCGWEGQPSQAAPQASDEVRAAEGGRQAARALGAPPSTPLSLSGEVRKLERPKRSREPDGPGEWKANSEPGQ